MGCEDFLVHGRVSMLLFCLTYALFFNKIGYLCRGGSLSSSYTRILALHLYSLFFPILTSRIVYLSAVPAKYEAECTTSETHRWVARDGPSVPGVCVGITEGDWQNTVPLPCSPSSRARSLQGY